MKTPPDTPEFRKFTDAMRVIMGVSKTGTPLTTEEEVERQTFSM